MPVLQSFHSNYLILIFIWFWNIVGFFLTDGVTVVLYNVMQTYNRLQAEGGTIDATQVIIDNKQSVILNKKKILCDY